MDILDVKTRADMIKFQEEHINKTLPYEVALKVVYIPTIFAQTAFYYLQAAFEYCARLRMPYKKEIREMREMISKYKTNTYGAIGCRTTELLFSKLDDLNDMAADSFDILWSSFKKQHLATAPHLSAERIVLQTNLSMAHIFLRYTVQSQHISEEEYYNETHYAMKFVDDAAVRLMKMMETMEGEFRLVVTDGMTEAMREIVTQIKILKNNTDMTNRDE